MQNKFNKIDLALRKRRSSSSVCVSVSRVSTTCSASALFTLTLCLSGPSDITLVLSGFSGTWRGLLNSPGGRGSAKSSCDEEWPWRQPTPLISIFIGLQELGLGSKGLLLFAVIGLGAVCEEGRHNSEEEIFSDWVVEAIQSLIFSLCTFWSSAPLTLKLIEEHGLALGFPGQLRWIVSFCLGGSGGGRSSVRSALLEEVVSEEAWLAELEVVGVDSHWLWDIRGIWATLFGFLSFDKTALWYIVAVVWFRLGMVPLHESRDISRVFFIGWGDKLLDHPRSLEEIML